MRSCERNTREIRGKVVDWVSHDVAEHSPIRKQSGSRTKRVLSPV